MPADSREKVPVIIPNGIRTTDDAFSRNAVMRWYFVCICYFLPGTSAFNFGRSGPVDSVAFNVLEVQSLSLFNAIFMNALDYYVYSNIEKHMAGFHT